MDGGNQMLDKDSALIYSAYQLWFDNLSVTA